MDAELPLSTVHYRESSRSDPRVVVTCVLGPDHRYRHVILPRDIAKTAPQNRLLEEGEWRGERPLGSDPTPRRPTEECFPASHRPGGAAVTRMGPLRHPSPGAPYFAVPPTIRCVPLPIGRHTSPSRLRSFAGGVGAIDNLFAQNCKLAQCRDPLQGPTREQGRCANRKVLTRRWRSRKHMVRLSATCSTYR